MKKALIIGCTYAGLQGNELPGTKNDVKELYYFLTREAGFHPENVLVLLDTTAGYLCDHIQYNEAEYADVDSDHEKDKKKDKKDKKDKNKEKKEKKDKKGKKDKKEKKEKSKKDKIGKHKNKDKHKEGKKSKSTKSGKTTSVSFETQYPSKYKAEPYPQSFAPPTRDNILDAIDWFVANVSKGDSLFFFFSGHGGQIDDLDGDEKDGKDETIVPLDFLENGEISDDELHRLLVCRIPKGAKLTALFDCCNSGTGMDLPFYCTAAGPEGGEAEIAEKQKAVLRQTEEEAGAGKKGGGGLVLLFSGCPDGDCSCDLIIDGQNCGILVNTFAGILRNTNFTITYQDLLFAMRVSGKENVPWTQIPQLSWNQKDFKPKQNFTF